METVVFSIDNVTDLHCLAKFLRWIDTNKALGKLTGDMKVCFGCYKGVIEQSFVMLRVDFDKYVRSQGWVDGQESFLMVPSDDRQPCTLAFSDGRVDVLGRLTEVSPAVVHRLNGWTYRPDLNLYFAA